MKKYKKLKDKIDELKRELAPLRAYKVDEKINNFNKFNNHSKKKPVKMQK
jgi:hypothetical protein